MHARCLRFVVSFSIDVGCARNFRRRRRRRLMTAAANRSFVRVTTTTKNGKKVVPFSEERENRERQMKLSCLSFYY